MKRKVLLIGIAIVMVVVGSQIIRMFLLNQYETHKEKILQMKRDEVISTPVKIVIPTPTTTPIEVEKSTPIPVVDKVLARREFVVSRGDVSREFRITESILEDIPILKMKGTAYTLSVASCGKKRSHPQYGITRNGLRAQVRRTVAVDPKLIPLGSVLYIKFPKEYSFRDGLYVADDTGDAVKGHKIDIFFGEDKPGEKEIENLADEFGVQLVQVYILERGD